MVTFECPWCTEPAAVASADLGELTCGDCGVSVAIAPDPIPERIDQAA